MKHENYLIHIIKSFGVHAVFGVILVASFTFEGPKETPQEAPEVSAIDAVVIDQASLEQQIKRIEKQKADLKAAEEKRVRELEERAKKAKQDLEKLDKQKNDSKKAAEEAKRKAQLEKKKAEKAKAERVKREKEAAKAKKAADDAKRKKEAEQKALQEAERKRKAEAERREQERLEKERKERERKEKEAQEKLLQEQLAQEQAIRQKARQKVVLSEVNKYQALIKAKIQQRLIVDDSMRGKSCRLNIRLASTGLVLQVNVISGEKSICDAAIRAVRKAETLPVSKEPDVYQELKDINLTVEPGL